MPDAFFHRPSTHQLIADLSEPRDWTIYVGLGATMDRTGISWSRLIDALLAEFIGDPGMRHLIIRHHGEIRSATVAMSLFRERFGEERYRQRMSNSISSLLYGPRNHMAGRLLEAIATFSLELQDRGKSVLLVTPNYDEYLYRELSDYAYLTPRATLFSQGDAEVSLHVAGTSTAILPQDWRTNHSVIPCVYLHGYIAEDTNGSKGDPVISEADYAQTHERTSNMLEEVFWQRNVLIVGSSVTDPPLVDALLRVSERERALPREKRGTHCRYAVLPRAGTRFDGADPDQLRPLDNWNAQRIRALGLSPICPDFYIQSAQLLMEIQRAMSHETADQMVAPVSPHRYGSRLATWWSEWFEQNCHDVEKTQYGHYRMLADALVNIRRLVSAPLEESLKLELWVRWNPQETRELRLWASSVGTWPDVRSMRQGRIEAGSRYKSVQAFCAGSPVFLHTT